MNSNINRLQKFRNDTYNLLGFAKDSTYDLMDAVLTTRTAYSLADFSLSPLFRRQWPSTYESLQDCRPNRSQLMKRYIKEIPLCDSSYVTLAIDHTANTRLDSPTLKDRGYHYSPLKKDLLPLELLWRKYLRRFAVDHWYRLLKQRLH